MLRRARCASGQRGGTSERAVRVPVLAGLTGPGLTGLPLTQLDPRVTVPTGPQGEGLAALIAGDHVSERP